MSSEFDPLVSGLPPATGDAEGGSVSPLPSVEERLKLAAEATGLALYEIDLKAGTIRFDEISSHLPGLSTARRIALNDWLALIVEEDRAVVDGNLRFLHEHGGTSSLEFRVRVPGWGLRCLQGTLRSAGNGGEASSSPRLLLALRDVTVQRDVEAELREVGQRFRLLVGNLDDVFWIVDWRTRRQLYISPSYTGSWGLDPAALFGSAAARWLEHIHPDDRRSVGQAFDALATAQRGDDRFAVEYRLKTGSGEQRWIRDRGIAVRDAAGEIQRVIGIAEDITDRRTVIRTLRDREQRLQLAVEAAQLHVWTLDATSRALTIADALCAIFGLSPKTCRRLGPWRRRLHAEDRPRVELAMRRLLQSGEPLNEEFRVLQPCGNIAWLAVRAILIADDSGPCIHGVAADVTARKEQEKALAQSERELRTITAALPIGIYRVSRDLRYLFVNEALASSLLASTPEQIIGRTVLEVTGEAAFNTLRPYIDQVLAGNRVQFETAMPLNSGFRHVHATYVPEFDAQGEVVSFVAVVENITERKLAEVKLHEREREFKTLAENAPDIIARVDRELRYVYINRAAETAFGVEREHQERRRSAEIGFPLEYVTAAEAVMTSAFEGGSEQSIHFSVAQPGRQRHFTARAVPEFDRNGVIESVLLIVYDVSERVRSQIERDHLLEREQEARGLAEAAARGRDEFLAIVSHELRSPLNGIQSWAHVLERTAGETSKGVQRAVTGIKTGVEQQVRLIDDLLDATRIMSGKLSLNLSPIKLLPVIVDAVESVRAKATQKSIIVETEISIVDEAVDGDIDRLQQIIWNLLSNAIKFTPSGGRIQLGAKREANRIVLSVTDNGRGIAADFLPHMFERFRRDETGNSRAQDGLGLGLMLVRHLCALHRGSVTASSPGIGQGATFTVWLPLRRAVSAEPEVTTSAASVTSSALPSLKGMRLLLVDDHVDSRDALAVLLAQAGATIEVESSGADAIQRMEKVEPSSRPDLLICDIAMPGTDGYETLRRIRALERSSGQPQLPAIALTAFAQNEDRVRALNAGFELHIPKPVAIEELIVTVAAFARHQRAAAASSSS